MEQKSTSTVADVLMHHVTSLTNCRLEDVLLDYSDESVVMVQGKTFRGLAEIRAFFQASIAETPPELFAAMTVLHQDIQGEVAFAVWKAEPFIKLGTDTFVIHNGKILAQTYVSAS
jgi:ketosteroid isomerase-like protein